MRFGAPHVPTVTTTASNAPSAPSLTSHLERVLSSALGSERRLPVPWTRLTEVTRVLKRVRGSSWYSSQMRRVSVGWVLRTRLSPAIIWGEEEGWTQTMQYFVALREGARPEDAGMEAVQKGVELEAGGFVHMCPDAAYRSHSVSILIRKQ